MNDNVNHPSHYTDGKIEVIDFIEDKNLNFHRGNAVKYIARAGKKNPEKEVEDLEKAVWYINREIKRLKPEPEKDEVEIFADNTILKIPNEKGTVEHLQFVCRVFERALNNALGIDHAYTDAYKNAEKEILEEMQNGTQG